MIKVAVCTLLLVIVGAQSGLTRDEKRANSVVSGQYARVDSAVLANDAATLKRICVEHFFRKDVSGNGEDFDAYVKELLPADSTVKIRSYRTDIGSVTGKTDTLIAEVSSTTSFDFTPQGASKAQSGVLISRSRDTWVLREGVWLLARSVAEEEQQSLDGREVEHRLAPVPISSPTMHALVTQIRQEAFPLKSTLPTASTDELAPLNRLVGDARLVGLGEGTHGTSEFFQMKDRLFRFLVEKMSFTVLGMEANWTDGLAIDRYITTGVGDPRKDLANTFAVWDNQETLDLVQWMRAYNARPGSHPVLRFVGFDMQSPQRATAMVEAYYTQRRFEGAAGLTAKYACLNFDYYHIYQEFSKMTQSDKASCLDNARSVYEDALRQHVSPEIEHAALVAKQAATMFSSADGGNARDAAMAENVKWIASTLYPDAKIVLWAHNGHIAAAPYGFQSMGSYLRNWYGNEYYAIGSTLDHGTVSLNGVTPPVNLPPALEGTSESVLRRAGNLYLLNLHAASSDSALGRWLAQPLQVAMLGAVSPNAVARAREVAVHLPQTFDSLIFVNATHAAHSFEIPAPERKIAVMLPAGTGGVAFPTVWTLRGSDPSRFVSSADATVHEASAPSLFLASTNAATAKDYGVLESSASVAPYLGKRVRLRCDLKSENIVGTGSCWLRIAGANGSTLSFDNGANRGVSGTAGWTHLSIVVDVPSNAISVNFGLLLDGPGKLWADDIHLETVSTNIPVTNLSEGASTSRGGAFIAA